MTSKNDQYRALAREQSAAYRPEPPEHRPVLGKVPRADLQRIECACGWLWDDRDPLDDAEGMDFMRHLASLAAEDRP